jgi:uncharacterized protein (DUF58 family)
METKDLLKKVRQIEIKTKGLTKQIFSGEYHSAFKGVGMAFSEVREYQVGDDVRTIDWNVTARFDAPFVKVFEEERELTVMLLIDVSDSTLFGSKVKSKKELSTEIAAVLSFSAIANNDKVGALLFSDKIEKFIPPKKGRKHALVILRELLEFKPDSKKTDIAQALSYFRNAIKRKSIAFVISDFIDDNAYSSSLQIAHRKHDMVAIQLYDLAERNIPKMGLIQMENRESGIKYWLNTQSRKTRAHIAQAFDEKQEEIKRNFKKTGTDFASISTQDSFIVPLMNLFKSRVS